MAILDLVIELALLIIIFSVIEYFFRHLKTKPWFKRPDVMTDIGYFFVNSLTVKVFEGIAIITVVAVIAMLGGVSLAELRDLIRALLNDNTAVLAPDVLSGMIASLPFWAQVLLGLLIADFIYYWGHRLFHNRPFWRLHAIHHSPPTLDWLSSVRSHPFEDAFISMLQVVPLLFLGFPLETFVVVTPIIAVWSVLSHANVSWDFGIFKYIIISPRFHRWHHTSESEGLDKNFAGIFPFFDLLFGTWFMPDRVPTEFGAGDTRVPAGLWNQLLFPFRKTAKGKPLAKDIF